MNDTYKLDKDRLTGKKTYTFLLFLFFLNVHSASQERSENPKKVVRLESLYTILTMSDKLWRSDYKGDLSSWSGKLGR